MDRQLYDIWKYRALLRELFVTWLKVRHTGSLLGVVWTLVNPAAFILTYWVVFTYVIKIDLPNYAAFLIPGFLAWNFTWNAITSACEAVIEGNYLITKIAFPSEILVLASVGVALFDFLVALILYLFFATLAGIAFTPIALALPLVLFCHVLFTLGLSLMAACGSVFFRDIPKLVGIAGLLLFFATPVFYPESVIPATLRTVFGLNPFTPFIALYHHVLYYDTAPPAHIVAGTVLLATIMSLAGMVVFRKFKPLFAEHG